MTWKDRRLLPAMGCSLLLHALLFIPGLPTPQHAPRKMPPLEARLIPPPAAEQPTLLPLEPPKPAKAERRPEPSKPERPKPAKAPAASGWMAEAKKQLREMDKRGELYPLEAIARGLEGEAVVLFVLDETGTVVAARIEQSSGHKILDDAALRAIYRFRSLPADAPREGIYPVHFRLK